MARHEVGREVRKTMARISGTKPEDMPALAIAQTAQRRTAGQARWQKEVKSKAIRLAISFREAIGDLLQVKPPPNKAKAAKKRREGTQGGRKGYRPRRHRACHHVR